jgi:hypothetical protein
MSDTDDAAAFARRLAGYEEGAIRARVAARVLAGVDPEAAAALLAGLARSGGAAERAAWAAVALALSGTAPEPAYAWRADLYALAMERGMAEVAGLLVHPPPRGGRAPPTGQADARLSHLTLGYKKSAARAMRDPDLLARLAAEGEPVVVRELLRNPKLTEDFVVRIAARRPVRPETLRCVFEERRWRTRPAVALAIARNPYVETALALKLLPALGAAELEDVARDGTVHPLVRALADRVAAERTRRAERARSDTRGDGGAT